MKSKVTATTNYFRDPSTAAIEPAVCSSVYQGSPYLHDLSYSAHHRNIFSPSILCSSHVCSNTGNSCTTASDCTNGASCVSPCENAQTITTHVVYTGPLTSTLPGLCDPYTQMSATATAGGTTINHATDPDRFYAILIDTFKKVIGGAASGTAASILSNSEGSGANILQAVFYPTKTFGMVCSVDRTRNCRQNSDCLIAGETCIYTEASWIGEMQNLWYYIDPFLNNSTIREDTGYTELNRAANAEHLLNLKIDNVVQFHFDGTQTKAKKFQDVNGDGDGNDPGDIFVGDFSADDVSSLWRAGEKLWETDPDARKIYTNVGGQLVDFLPSIGSNATFQSYLQVADPAEATKLINFVRGTDYPDYRGRTVRIKDEKRVWKLGDIISSTPRLQSSSHQNSYGLLSPSGYSDTSYADDRYNAGYANTSDYKERGKVYVGANDGMLHAFKLGKLDVTPSGDRKAKLTALTPDLAKDLGKEDWAFIPLNVLPYLKYMSEQKYSHLYAMDGSTVIVDASIGIVAGSCSETTDYWKCPKDYTSGTGNTWRTVLVGSMGIGGASRNKDNPDCNDLATTGSCVKTPVPGVGYSSYYALDITDSDNPKLLWEFSSPEPGFCHFRCINCARQCT